MAYPRKFKRPGAQCLGLGTSRTLSDRNEPGYPSPMFFLVNNACWYLSVLFSVYGSSFITSTYPEAEIQRV